MNVIVPCRTLGALATAAFSVSCFDERLSTVALDSSPQLTGMEPVSVVYHPHGVSCYKQYIQSLRVPRPPGEPHDF